MIALDYVCQVQSSIGEEGSVGLLACIRRALFHIPVAMDACVCIHGVVVTGLFAWPSQVLNTVCMMYDWHTTTTAATTKTNSHSRFRTFNGGVMNVKSYFFGILLSTTVAMG